MGVIKPDCLHQKGESNRKVNSAFSIDFANGKYLSRTKERTEKNYTRLKTIEALLIIKILLMDYYNYQSEIFLFSAEIQFEYH